MSRRSSGPRTRSLILISPPPNDAVVFLGSRRCGLSPVTGRCLITDVRYCLVLAISPPEDERAPIVGTTTTDTRTNTRLEEAVIDTPVRIIDRHGRHEGIAPSGAIVAGIVVEQTPKSAFAARL